MVFSPVGRIGRAKWWLTHLAHVPLLLIYGTIAVVCIASAASPLIVVGVVLLVLMLPLLIYSSFCLNIKRYHDRNKSGWWSLIGLIPIVGLWQLIECGFLAGDWNDNDYGPGPEMDIGDDIQRMKSAASRGGGVSYSETRSYEPPPAQQTASSAAAPGRPTFGKRS